MAKEKTPTKPTDTTQPEAPAKFGRELAKEKTERDEMGLLKSVSYQFKDSGFVDWKAMIPKQYIAVNEEYFQKRNIEVPKSIDGLEDKQLIVLLAGIKELAVLRGVATVNREVVESGPERAVVKCSVTFTPNYETQAGMPIVYDEVANATLFNTNSFSQSFLETIASNRAFVRAIRNALRIDIVGSDELSSISYSNDNAETTSQVAPWMALAEAAKNYTGKASPEGFKTFESFKSFLIDKKVDGASEWNDWKDIPVPSIWKFIGQLNKSK